MQQSKIDREDAKIATRIRALRSFGTFLFFVLAGQILFHAYRGNIAGAICMSIVFVFHAKWTAEELLDDGPISVNAFLREIDSRCHR